MINQIPFPCPPLLWSPDGAERSALASMNMQITEQMKAQQAMLARPYTPTLYDQMAMSNYRPPVHVPAGWADWSAHADELT